MANILPVPVKKILAASGGLAPVTLMEVLNSAGTFYAWSDANVTVTSMLAETTGGRTGTGSSVSRVGDSLYASFVPWIITPPTFTQYKSTTMATADVTVQNLTGDTIRRDMNQIYANNELINALVYFRLWKLEAEYSMFDFQGNIRSANISADGDSIDISISGSYAMAQVPAPREQIGPTCGNIFNSGGSFYACGSTSATPCNNDYGTCSSLNRFAGVLNEWVSDDQTQIQMAQQQPLRVYNPKVAG